MSVSVPVSYLFNRNDKFEVFLRRCLTQEQFERIRGYERCIVCDGKKLNKAFCFYVVTDKSILITENPPKSVLLNILLSSLTQCEIIDDYPDFLDANLTTQSTHVQLRYRPHVETVSASLDNKSQSIEKAQQNNEGSTEIHPERDQTGNKKTSFFGKLFSRKPKHTTDQVESPADVMLNDHVTEPSSHGLKFVSGEEDNARRKARKAGEAENGDSVLDIHFLTNITPLCLLTKITWNNCLISSTLSLEDTKSDCKALDSERLVEFENIHAIFQHFDLYMRQLVTSIKVANLENFVQMASKFDDVAHHSFALRRIFWKSPANVTALAGCAAHFAKEIDLGVEHQKPQNLFQNIWQKQVFHLRLECLVTTLRLLATFMKETEILRNRTKILEESKNNVVVVLIDTICDALAYTTRHLYPAKDRKTNHNKPLMTQTEELFENLLEASSALLFEIILSGQAMVHPTESAHFYNVRYLVAQFESSAQYADALFGLTYDAISSVAFKPPTNDGAKSSRVLSNLLNGERRRHAAMSPSRAVQTYRQFFILDILTFNSHLLLNFLREKLTEEFKYFIVMSSVADEIGNDYPIGTALISLIGAVRQRILVKTPQENFHIFEPAPLEVTGGSGVIKV